MNPRNPLAIWQKIAQVHPVARYAFAKARGFCNTAPTRFVRATSLNAAHDCYPFPSPWPGPFGVRPFFFGALGGAGRGGGWAVFPHSREFGFQIGHDAVKSAAIIIKNRGSQTCVKLFSSFRSLQCRLPVACVTTRNVPLRARALALWQPLRWTVTLATRWLRAPQALPLVRFATTSAFATDLTHRHRAFTRLALRQDHGGVVPAWSFAFRAPARADLRREPCSRRS